MAIHDPVRVTAGPGDRGRPGLGLLGWHRRRAGRAGQFRVGRLRRDGLPGDRCTGRGCAGSAEAIT